MDNRISTLILVPFFTLTLFSVSCQPNVNNQHENYIPIKNPEMTQATYDKYLGLLEKAYDKNDHFEAAIQLANLKADKKNTYQALNNAIKNNPDNCNKVYEWYWLYDRHNFRMNILKHDTTLFKQSVNLCNDLNVSNGYDAFAKMKDQEEKDAQANKEMEDSTNYNIPLVRKLEKIRKEDQEIRNRLSAKTVTPEQRMALEKEMNKVDSINMEKIDRIFKEHGYPSRDLVGKECNFTPALVIHHSNSLETRYKYLPILEKAVEDDILYEGTLEMIKTRIGHMELDKK